MPEIQIQLSDDEVAEQGKSFALIAVCAVMVISAVSVCWAPYLQSFFN